ncbi:MAG: formylglycine-generating enzyme family protein, partial [Myxococcales bacterium]|nr:formylglycine-generating enzyme family protein [Myxococcales bacterium]
YRLPTEAEWEYAARAGTTTRYWSGDTKADLARVGWYDKNSGGKTHPVAQMAANPWGLFDVHGNVREWCVDWLGNYPAEPQTDPLGAPRGEDRVVRGGSFGDSADGARSAGRVRWRPWFRDGHVGFRLARPAPSPTSS